MSGFQGRDLTCIRGQRLVFDRLDFSVETGDLLLLRGPNGAGKSSLLRLMAALLRPAAGALTWDGKSIWSQRDEHQVRITYVGHLDGVKAPLTGCENVAFWAVLAGHGNRDADARARLALDRLGIEHLADVPARLMSAGQKRRVNLARLAAVPSPIWLLDEPATSLDDAGAAALSNMIGDHLDSGGMAIAATHQSLLAGRAQELQIGEHANANLDEETDG